MRSKFVKMRKKRNIIENMPEYSNNQLNAAIEASKKGTNIPRIGKPTFLSQNKEKLMVDYL